MAARTGLLVVTNPLQIAKVLTKVSKEVHNTLYIQLISALTDQTLSFYPNIFNSWPSFSNILRNIYSHAAATCTDVDIRVLLSNLRNKDITKIKTQHPIDLVIFDKKLNNVDVEKFIKDKVSNMNKFYGVLTVDTGEVQEVIPNENGSNKVYKHGVLGGTFDRLHLAHKVLLTETCLRSSETITVGVTDENMLMTKTLWELIEPVDVRMNNVQNFLTDVCPELNSNVVCIRDAFGPTQHDPTMDILVVSSETLGGGNKVNEVRTNKGLPKVDVYCVELLDDPCVRPNEELKISSSTGRMRLLGSLLKPVDMTNLPIKPYVIGLTGGIASGKSNVAQHLNELGAQIINCDLVAHDVYKLGKPCYGLLKKEFGDRIISENGEIDRKVLGGIVFADAEKLNKLNSLVWPAVGEELSCIIKSSTSTIIVMEAAVLLTAGWNKFCHEVWTTLVPREAAIKRLIERNNLTKEQAANRIDSQKSNMFYVDAANVVICSLWAKEFTYEQVDKAWCCLKTRVASNNSHI